jgi:hypothetical protein
MQMTEVSGYAEPQSGPVVSARSRHVHPPGQSHIAATNSEYQTPPKKIV